MLRRLANFSSGSLLLMAGYFANWNRLLPRKLRPDSMEEAMTLSAVMTPMTEKTPMATPSMVSPERSLLVFSAVSASLTVSFIAERFDRIEPRGGDGRRDPGEDAGHRRHDQADDDQTEREGHRKRWKRRRHRRGHQPGEDDPNRAADQTDRHRLDEELQQDGALPRAHCFSCADLAGALAHADVGDVHDADGADEQGQPGDEQSRAGDARLHRADRAAHAFLLVDGEVVLLLGREAAHAAHVTGELVARGGEEVLVLHLHADRRVEARAEDFRERGERHDGVRVEAEQAEEGSLLGEDADDAKRVAVDE